MKRLHVHISVEDLERSIDFYSTLFAGPPDVLKNDYAKWMLEDPRVNFAISQRARVSGVDHLGLQVETEDELREVTQRLAVAGARLVEQSDAACCYARSDKTWVNDPQGIAWETFHTHGEITVYGEDTLELAEAEQAEAACCDQTGCGTPAGGSEALSGKAEKACCA